MGKIKQYRGKYSVAPVKKEVKPVSNKNKDNFHKKWNRFLRRVKRNTKYQVALWIVLCILISLVTRLHQSVRDKLIYTAMMETQREEIVAEYEQKMADLRLSYEEDIEVMRNEYENLTPEELIKQEAEYMARALYAYRDNSDRDLRTACWCMLNRVDNPSFPDSVKEVCQQPKQWMGYKDDNPILNNLYEIAYKELETWHSGYRPVNMDYVYMSWSSKEIVLRTTYEIAKNTRYWQAG